MPYKNPNRQREYQRVWQNRRNEESHRNNRCTRCRTKGPVNGITRCWACALKHLALRHLGNSGKWRSLANLFSTQKGKCAYTGRDLTLGVNASVEHILPSSKFPHKSNDIKNICWVDTQINSMKNDSSFEEFIQNCIDVITYNGYEVRKAA